MRRGERRAHEIIVESDQCAALIEEQLTYLTDQIEHVRVRLTEIRARLAREARSDRNVILAHPHPSGVAEPSQADEFITQRLKEALGLVDIRVLDHIIVAGGDTISLAERGLL